MRTIKEELFWLCEWRMEHLGTVLSDWTEFVNTTYLHSAPGGRPQNACISRLVKTGRILPQKPLELWGALQGGVTCGLGLGERHGDPLRGVAWALVLAGSGRAGVEASRTGAA